MIKSETSTMLAACVVMFQERIRVMRSI